MNLFMRLRLYAAPTMLAVPLFFGLKIISGLLLLKLSALYLSVDGFTVFTQFFLLSALLNMVAVGGTQNGVIRQTAAATSPTDMARTVTASLLIWIGALSVIGVPVILLKTPAALFLTGTTESAWAVPWIVSLSFIAGPGQIFCALLTGVGRAQANLTAQAAGLLTGTIAAAAFLFKGEAVWAVIAFCGGPLITSVISTLHLHRLALDWRPTHQIKQEVKTLFRYSGAFVIVAGFTSLMFFGLRYYYREAFGVEALGQWLVASRISDTSTQLLGLYMTQIFLPKFARMTSPLKSDALLKESWGLASLVMLAFPLCFMVAPDFFVTLFLSKQYLPAVPAILIYMAGDTLRVATSLAAHAAFARAKLMRYVIIEVGSIALFAGVTIWLVNTQNKMAPMLGYISAYTALAVFILFLYLRSRHRVI